MEWEKQIEEIAEEWATSVINELEEQDKKIEEWRKICVEAGIKNAEIKIRRKKKW